MKSFNYSVPSYAVKSHRSYFSDELQSLNNKTPTSQNNMNKIEEKTALENKIKLLEIENKLLKGDNSNKQKFKNVYILDDSIGEISRRMEKSLQKTFL